MTTLVWKYDTEHGFEDEYATYHGVPHCVGDEVIIVSNTAVPTAVAIDSPC